MFAEADEKYPGQTGKGIPPSPTIENPGQVYPRADPEATPLSVAPGTSSQGALHSVTGNPYLFENGLRKLDMSLGDLINILENEAASSSCSNKGFSYLEKFKGWRKELMEMRRPQSRFYRISDSSGAYRSPSEEGGIFVE